MTTKLKLFHMNPGLNDESFKIDNNICTPDRCRQNFEKRIETTIYLDTNIISNIRKFTFKERDLDSRICNLINQIIEIFTTLPYIYISPGLALYESCPTYIEKILLLLIYFLTSTFHDLVMPITPYLPILYLQGKGHLI